MAASSCASNHLGSVRGHRLGEELLEGLAGHGVGIALAQEAPGVVVAEHEPEELAGAQVTVEGLPEEPRLDYELRRARQNAEELPLLLRHVVADRAGPVVHLEGGPGEHAPPG